MFRKELSDSVPDGVNMAELPGNQQYFESRPQIITDITEKLKRAKELCASCSDQNSREELLKIIDALSYYIPLAENNSAEEAANENLKRLELAVETVNLAWWAMDVPTGNVQFHKRKAEMLGYDPADFTHYSHFTGILHPDDYEKSMQAMRDHIYGSVPMYESLYRIKKADGTYTWFSDAGAIVKRTPDGKPLRIVGFVIDVSKLKEAELEIRKKNEELIKLNAEKDKFFSIIAHDLRNPLWALMQLSEFLIEDAETMSNEDREQMIRNLGESASNAYKLLENLLEWSRMQRGYIFYNPQALNVSDTIAGSIKILRDSASLKNIKIRIFCSSELMMTADKNMTDVVLRNLVSNAIKFTPNGGTVDINVSETDDDQIIISVKDSGIGMSRDILQNLFILTSDVKRPGTEGEKSSGLGLILSKEYVEKNKGLLTVESEEGKGSVFSFTVPACKSE